MGIFKKENFKRKIGDDKFKTVGMVFVGAHLPPQINSYLTLYSLAKTQSKDSLIREQMTKWVAEKEKEFSIQSLEKELAEAFYEVYKDSDEDALDMFLIELKKELRKKGVQKEQFDNIIEHLGLLFENDEK